MKPYLALLALFLIGTTHGMNFTETAYYQGIQEGYHLGALAIQGQSDPAKESEYNSLIADLNSWLASVGYYDYKWANLQKNIYSLPPIFADYQKPIIFVNESKSIIHAIDGNMKSGVTYTTNDMNLLPDRARYNSTSGNYDKPGDYLGGI